mmetsp:Transcript_3705/g.7679  ORF Transcript_3705/g.7679 Transcript_3705/m.7679 type:complete len:82 (-) Transcript_3705:1447-1692(-)
MLHVMMASFNDLQCYRIPNSLTATGLGAPKQDNNLCAMMLQSSELALKPHSGCTLVPNQSLLLARWHAVFGLRFTTDPPPI